MKTRPEELREAARLLIYLRQRHEAGGRWIAALADAERDLLAGRSDEAHSKIVVVRAEQNELRKRWHDDAGDRVQDSADAVEARASRVAQTDPPKNLGN